MIYNLLTVFSNTIAKELFCHFADICIDLKNAKKSDQGSDTTIGSGSSSSSRSPRVTEEGDALFNNTQGI